jgi:hypothetical protein
VSNWISWVEVLYLAFRCVHHHVSIDSHCLTTRLSFNPVFVLPVAPSPAAKSSSTATGVHTGRRTGTGSAAVSTPSNRLAVERIPIKGFRKASLFSMISFAGNVPTDDGPFLSLDEIRRTARRPVVVFPECATSNGRGMLRFAEVFMGTAVPVKGYKVLVACFRYVCYPSFPMHAPTLVQRCDPPTALTPTLTHSIPTRANPLPQLFSLASSLAPLSLSVRFFAPSECPSSPSFMPSEIVGTDVGEDVLAASCAGLIAQLGKLRRVQFGWEEKVAFLALYNQKRR